MSENKTETNKTTTTKKAWYKPESFGGFLKGALAVVGAVAVAKAGYEYFTGEDDSSVSIDLSETL